MTKWYGYMIPAIDIGWEHLKTVKETLSDLAKSASIYSSDIKHDVNERAVRDFLEDWALVKEAAGKEGWEGDFRYEPSVFWIPDETEFVYAFVFKQDNNGTTFVVAPVPLPWLDRHRL